MSVSNREITYFSFIQVMLRLERMGHIYLERMLGEDDEAYLLRTKKAFPGVFDDMVPKTKRLDRPV